MNTRNRLVAETDFSRFPPSEAASLFPMNSFSAGPLTSATVYKNSPISGCSLVSAPNITISPSICSANTSNCNINKRKRRPAGTPDPDAEVVSLSPKTLMESDRYVCEICNQGFQRDQNLQMHRRRHKVPWRLLKRPSPEARKRVYICPEPSCLHYDPCHALGDLVGIKKHYRRKHSTDKQWKCEKCGKGYAVQSDYKAHLKTCGTRGHCCDCGLVFSRVETFIEHQDNCSIAKEKAALGSSEQTSIASLLTRNASPSQSNDNISMTTWAGVSSSAGIRQINSIDDARSLFDQQEFQFLGTKHCSEKPVPDCANSITKMPLILNTEKVSTFSTRYVEDTSDDLWLRLSIGLPSPEKSHYNIKSQSLESSYESVEEANHNHKLLKENSRFVLKNFLSQKTQDGGAEHVPIADSNEMLDMTFLSGGPTRPARFVTQETPSLKNYQAGQVVLQDQRRSRLTSSGHLKIDLQVGSATIDFLERGGFGNPNSRQSKLQDEPKSLQTDLVLAPHLNSLYSSTFEHRDFNDVTVHESAMRDQWDNQVMMRVSSPDPLTVRRSKGRAVYEFCGEPKWPGWEETKPRSDFAGAGVLRQIGQKLELDEAVRQLSRKRLVLGEAELAETMSPRHHSELGLTARHHAELGLTDTPQMLLLDQAADGSTGGENRIEGLISSQAFPYLPSSASNGEISMMSRSANERMHGWGLKSAQDYGNLPEDVQLLPLSGVKKVGKINFPLNSQSSAALLPQFPSQEDCEK